MRNLMSMTLAAATLIAAGSTFTQAQTTCKGKVVVDAVYQVGTGTNQYEYYVQLRNATGTATTATVNLSTFGTTVTLFSPVLPGIPLAAYKSEKVKFGRGSNGQINTGTVKVQYDTTASSSRPTVSVTGCK